MTHDALIQYEHQVSETKITLWFCVSGECPLCY